MITCTLGEKKYTMDFVSGRALREMEAEIQAELAKGIGNNNITVLELVDKYLATMQGVRHNTAANYKTVRNTLSKEAFGYYKIKRVKTSDAKLFLIKLNSISLNHTTRFKLFDSLNNSRNRKINLFTDAGRFLSCILFFTRCPCLFRVGNIFPQQVFRLFIFAMDFGCFSPLTIPAWD